MPGSNIESIELKCAINRDDYGRPILTVELFNGSPDTIHLFDSQRMPYFIREDDGTLLILFGVHAPDPKIDYSIIEIPLTRPLPPGVQTYWEVNLAVITLKNHYAASLEPIDLHGSVRVVVQVGWGPSPIPRQERYRINIHTLLEWQKLATVEVGEVNFP